ncbi:DUF2188 domain-containing protein [Spirosoma arcticum]
MWTTSHFPAAMRSLNPSTRLKAIEIANQLLEKGHVDKQRIISTSIDEARRWARCEHADSDVLLNQMRPFL